VQAIRVHREIVDTNQSVRRKSPLDPLALGKYLNAGSLYDGDMEEHIFAVVLGGDKAEALLTFEPLHSAQFDQFMQEMVASISPRGPLEHQLVLRAGSLLWRLRRIPSFEVALFERARGDIHGDPMGMNALQLRARKTIAKMDEDKRDVYELGALAHKLLSHDILRRLTHYEVTLSRQLSQTLLELHQLMASRPIPEKIEAPAVIRLPRRLQTEVLPSTGESAQRTGGNPGDEPPFPD